jgi:hypothetical protein
MLMLQADCLLPHVLLKQCLRHVCNCWLGACSIRSSGSATLFVSYQGAGLPLAAHTQRIQAHCQRLEANTRIPGGVQCHHTYTSPDHLISSGLDIVQCLTLDAHLHLH